MRCLTGKASIFVAVSFVLALIHWNPSSLFGQIDSDVIKSHGIVSGAAELVEETKQKIEELQKLKRKLTSVKAIADANVTCEQIVRNAKWLAKFGEPLAYDFYFRGKEDSAFVVEQSRQFASKVQKRAAKEKSRQSSARSRQISKIQKLLDNGSFLRADKEMRELVDDANRYQIFLKRTYLAELIREYRALDTRVQSALHAKQMTKSKMELMAFGEAVNTDCDAFFKSCEVAVEDIAKTGTTEVFESKMTQIDLVEHIVQTWREFEKKKAKIVGSEWLVAAVAVNLHIPEERSIPVKSVSYSQLSSRKFEDLLIDVLFAQQDLELNERLNLTQRVYSAFLSLVADPQRLREIVETMESGHRRSIDGTIQDRYFEATNELLKWRREFTEVCLDREIKQGKYPAKLLKDVSLSLKNPNASIPKSIKRLDRSFVGKNISAYVMVNSNRLILRPYHQRATIFSQVDCDTHFKELHRDLLVKDTLPPPSFQVMRELMSADTGMVGGTVTRALVNSEINSALGVSTFRQPFNEYSNLDSLRLSFALEPRWFRHRLFFARFGN